MYWFRFGGSLQQVVRQRGLRGQSGKRQGRQSRYFLKVERLESRLAPAFLDAVTFDLGPPLHLPFAEAVGDFNLDGLPDIAVTNGSLGTHSLLVLLNDGGGGFGTLAEYQTGFYPTSIAAADLNWDGVLDLVTSNFRDGTVSELLGYGDGTFAEHLDYPVNQLRPQAVVVSDLNGDYLADLATANYGSNSVSVLLSYGDGTFAPPMAFSAGSSPAGLAAADFNLDSVPDLLVTNYNSGTVSLLAGYGDGTFAPPIASYAGPFPKSPTMPVADFNGDYVPDAVVANLYGNTVTVLLGYGDGTFQAAAYPTFGYNTQAVAIADFNLDGILDLVSVDSVAPYPDLNVSVLLGLGDGTFAAAQFYTSGGVYSLDVAAADFNLDGFADLVVSNGNSNNVALLSNDGVWGLQTSRQLLADSAASALTALLYCQREREGALRSLLWLDEMNG